MSRRSLTRDRLESRMRLNPEKKAEMLAQSRHRRHMKYVSGLLTVADKLKARAAETSEGTVDPTEA